MDRIGVDTRKVNIGSRLIHRNDNFCSCTLRVNGGEKVMKASLDACQTAHVVHLKFQVIFMFTILLSVRRRLDVDGMSYTW